MQKVELILEDDFHLSLQQAAERASQSVDQLIRDLLRKGLQQFDFDQAFSDELLAEGYRKMAAENSQDLKEFMAAQMIALDAQNGDHDDFD
jgi:predicted DNA-binding ribbon-helix-helix protein